MLALGAYWAPWPLEGTRAKPELAGVSSDVIKQADARLWQDPFAAVQKDKRRKDKQPTTIRPSDLYARECATPANCTILGVMLDAGPYVGAEESRRRIRYAAWRV